MTRHLTVLFFFVFIIFSESNLVLHAAPPPFHHFASSHFSVPQYFFDLFCKKNRIERLCVCVSVCARECVNVHVSHESQHPLGSKKKRTRIMIHSCPLHEILTSFFRVHFLFDGWGGGWGGGGVRVFDVTDPGDRLFSFLFGWTAKQEIIIYYVTFVRETKTACECGIIILLRDT